MSENFEKVESNENEKFKKSNATCKIDFTPFCCASSIAF